MGDVVKPWIVLLALALVAGSFQNCGQAMKVAKTEGGFDALSVARTADALWAVDSKEAPEINENGRVLRWRELKSRNVNLYPPTFASTMTFILALSAIFNPARDAQYIRFNEDVSLAPALSDFSEMTSDQFTFVMVVKDLVIPSEDPKVLRLFHFYPSNGDASGQFLIDIARDGEDLYFHAYEWFEPTSIAFRRMKIGGEALKHPIAIAMRADRDARKIHLAINGKLTDEAAFAQGTQLSVAATARNLILHSPENIFGSGGEFSLSHFVLYKTAASDEELSAISGAFYRGAMGLPAGDPIDIGGDPTQSAGAKLYRQHCFSCHGPLATSTKLNRTLAQLNGAIGSVPTMSHLSSLAQGDRQKIVDALNGR